MAEEIVNNTLSTTRREGWRVRVWIEDGRVRLALEDGPRLERDGAAGGGEAGGELWQGWEEREE